MPQCAITPTLSAAAREPGAAAARVESAAPVKRVAARKLGHVDSER